MRTFIVVTAVAALLVVTGCDTDNSSGPDDGLVITETDLFPFVVGRRLVYNEYALDTTESQKVASTEHRHTIHVESELALNGKSAYLLIDSVYTPDGQLESLDSTYAAVEGGSLFLEFEGGWGKAFDHDVRTNTTYNVGMLIDNSLGFPVSVTVEGTIRNKENVVTPSGTYSAYRLELVGKVSLAGLLVESPQWYFFADGVGIVKFVEPVMSNPLTGEKEEGTEMVLIETHF